MNGLASTDSFAVITEKRFGLLEEQLEIVAGLWNTPVGERRTNAIGRDIDHLDFLASEVVPQLQ